MPTDLQLANPNQVPESWKGPDGKLRPEAWGAVILAGVAVVPIALYLKVIIDFLLGLFIDAFHLGLLVAGCVFLGYLLLGKRPRLIFRVLIRKLTSIFVAVYPVELIEDKLLQMEKRKSVFDKMVGLVDGAVQKLKRQIQKNQSDYTTGMRNAAQAHKMAGSTQDAEEAQKLDLQTQLQARRAQRRQNANIGYDNLLGRLTGMYKFLVRYSNNIDFLIEDTKDEVEQKKTEYETTETAFGAFSMAMKIIKGNAVEEDMYNQAFEQIENTISSQLGMMDDMQRLSENFMRGMDIENGAVDQQALDALTAFEQKMLTAGSTGADPALKMVTTDMSNKQAVAVQSQQYTAPSTSKSADGYDDLLR